jgi:two-component system invasion response regulator UvrY
MKFKVMLADDHAIIRDGLRKILADTDDFEVVAQASNGNAVLEEVRQQAFDLLVLDLSMPGRHGLELIKLLRDERPKLPILIFSMHPEEQFAVRALRVGANGYLSKEGDSDLILPAMRKVVTGGMFISNKVAELLAMDASPSSQALPHTLLSDREFEVLTHILRGSSLTDIANELSLSIKTVSTHKSHIFTKLGISSQVDLIRYAMEHRLTDGLPQ